VPKARENCNKTILKLRRVLFNEGRLGLLRGSCRGRWREKKKGGLVQSRDEEKNKKCRKKAMLQALHPLRGRKKVVNRKKEINNRSLESGDEGMKPETT